jgi:hypothetical protein
MSEYRSPGSPSSLSSLLSSSPDGPAVELHVLNRYITVSVHCGVVAASLVSI